MHLEDILVYVYTQFCIYVGVRPDSLLVLCSAYASGYALTWKGIHVVAARIPPVDEQTKGRTENTIITLKSYASA